MAEWFSNNIGTILAGLVVLAIVVSIVINMLIRKKRGQKIIDCGGNCNCCGAACAETAIPEKYRGLIKTVVGIDGMMCGMCESHINDAIRNHFTVEAVHSSHKKRETVIISREAIDEDELCKVIEETGYKVTSYTRMQST